MPKSLRSTDPASSAVLAEAQVLGALLHREGDGIATLPFSDEDFLSETHRRIWRVMAKRHENGEPINAATIYREAETKASVCLQVMNTVVTGTNLGYFSEELGRIIVARRREAISKAMAMDVQTAPDPVSVARKAEKDIEAIQARYLPSCCEPEFESVLSRVFSDLRAGVVPDVLMTGCCWWDRATKGLMPGEQSIIAARPSVGKTDLAIQLMMCLAKRKVRSCFFSIEMTAEALLHRILAVLTMDDVTPVFRATTPNPITRNNILEKEREAREIVRYIDLYTRNVSRLELIVPVMRRSVAHGSRAMFLDYLQLMHGDGRSRNEEIERISRGVREAAKDLRIPSILLAQINRSQEKDKRPPRLSDLKDSGAIEQDADMVMLLHRDEGAEMTKAIIAKGRNIGRGVVPLRHTGATHTFYEIEEDAR